MITEEDYMFETPDIPCEECISYAMCLIKIRNMKRRKYINTGRVNENGEYEINYWGDTFHWNLIDEIKECKLFEYFFYENPNYKSSRIHGMIKEFFKNEYPKKAKE